MVTFEDVLDAKAVSPQKLNEVSLSRVWQHTQGAASKSYGILTSWRAGKSHKDNLATYKKLEGEVRSLGLGYFKLLGHWRECQVDVPYDECPDDQLVDAKEPALFVPNIELKDMDRLRRKYDQDAVIYSGPETEDQVSLITGGSPRKLGKFSPGKIAQAYSQIRGRPFVFEYVAQSWNENLIIQERLKRLTNEARELLK